jgi:hypothetical protein
LKEVLVCFKGNSYQALAIPISTHSLEKIGKLVESALLLDYSQHDG